MNITLMDSMPVHCQPYRVSHYEWQQQDIIQQLMEANIIGEIDSPFSSSMILRSRKRQTTYECAYRVINRKTVKLQYHMSRVQD